MDVGQFFDSLAGLMSQLYVLDVNGVPTTQHMNAKAQAPMSLTETDLPTWIFIPLNATYPSPPDQTMERFAKETRDFEIRCYVTISQSGIDGEAQRRVQPYIDIGRDHIQKHIRLWDGNPYNEVIGLQRAWLMKDSGVATLRYGSNDKPMFLGVSYTVRVECLNEVDYADQ
jgi:hypothetical protein